MTDATYSPRQIHFCLGALISVPLNVPGTTAEQVAENAAKKLNQVLDNQQVIALIGRWQLAWGPYVFKSSPNVFGADDMMCVYQSMDDPSQYVIGIAGTNFLSPYSIINQDVIINPMVDWAYGDKVGQITQGTHVGLTNLLTLGQNGQNLSDFLRQSVFDNGASGGAINIGVAGHSLGGTLTPALAMYLRDTQSEYDPQQRAVFNVTPSAGLTPANKQWVNHYDSVLGAVTDRLWNAKDVAPHLWQLGMVAQIPTLYSPYIPRSVIIDSLTLMAEVSSAKAGRLNHVCANTAPLNTSGLGSHAIDAESLKKVLGTLTGIKLTEHLNKVPDVDAEVFKQVDVLLGKVGHMLESELQASPAFDAKGVESLVAKAYDLLGVDGGAFKWQIIYAVAFMIVAVYEHVFAYFGQLDVWGFVKQVYAPS